MPLVKMIPSSAEAKVHLTLFTSVKGLPSLFSYNAAIVTVYSLIGRQY